MVDFGTAGELIDLSKRWKNRAKEILGYLGLDQEAIDHLSAINPIDFLRLPDDDPTFAGVDPQIVRNLASTMSGTEIRAALDELSDEEFATFEKEQVQDLSTGFYADLLEALSNEEIVTAFGIFSADEQEDIEDFFDEPGVLLNFASMREEKAQTLLTEADLEKTTRSGLMFTYKFFQTHGHELDADSVLEEDSRFDEAYTTYVAFLDDVYTLSEGTGGMRQNDPRMQQLIKGLRDPLVREVAQITTSTDWLNGRVGVLDELSPINDVSRLEFSRFIGEVGRVLDSDFTSSAENTEFAASKQAEFTARYQASGTDQAFEDWAAFNLLPVIVDERLDELPLDMNGFDSEVDPIISDLLRGMPMMYSLPARGMIKDMLFLLAQADNITHKSQLVLRHFSKEDRASWLETYIATDIIGGHPNAELINEAVSAAGLNLTDVFRSLLEVDSAESPDAIALDFNASRKTTLDSFLAVLTEMSPEVASAVAQPSDADAVALEQINAFESTLNPMLADLGIMQVWGRRIKDAYIETVYPVGADRAGVLVVAQNLQQTSFAAFARQYVKDAIGREWVGGEKILEAIQDKYNGDPFEFFSLSGVSSKNVKTLGELNRLSDKFVPDEAAISLQLDQLIRDQAGFYSAIPDVAQPDMRRVLEGRVSELASKAGVSLEDFIQTVDLDMEAEFKAAGETFLNTLFPDEMMQDIVSINAEGSIIDFFSNNKFGGQTIDEIVESVQDFELSDPFPGESDAKAEARERYGEAKQKEKEDKEIEERARQDALDRARRPDTFDEDQERLEEDKRLADITREERARQYDFEDPFARAFEKQANRFLFGAQGRAVAQDVGGLALQEFEKRINVTRDRVETDTGERPSFRQLFSGEFPEVGNIDQYVQREFDVDFFTESARRSRQSRTQAPRIGVNRRTNQSTTPRLGATGGR